MSVLSEGTKTAMAYLRHDSHRRDTRPYWFWKIVVPIIGKSYKFETSPFNDFADTSLSDPGTGNMR